jgi:hypothetical protein
MQQFQPVASLRTVREPQRGGFLHTTPSPFGVRAAYLRKHGGFLVSHPLLGLQRFAADVALAVAPTTPLKPATLGGHQHGNLLRGLVPPEHIP